jgi:hypothetical protein
MHPVAHSVISGVVVTITVLVWQDSSVPPAAALGRAVWSGVSVISVCLTLLSISQFGRR